MVNHPNLVNLGVLGQSWRLLEALENSWRVLGPGHLFVCLLASRALATSLQLGFIHARSIKHLERPFRDNSYPPTERASSSQKLSIEVEINPPPPLSVFLHAKSTTVEQILPQPRGLNRPIQMRYFRDEQCTRHDEYQASKVGFTPLDGASLCFACLAGFACLCPTTTL